MRNKNKKLVPCLAVAAALAAPAVDAGGTSQRDKDIAEIGDWVQIGLPIAGYVGAWLSDDREGTRQLTRTLIGASVSAHVFKQLAERSRPDASDSRSFPSGHTTAAFAGSEFIRQRYGNKWGIPATAAAAFVGYSRIRANKHFRDDVLAGASNGLLWNWYYTTSKDSALSVVPTSPEGGVGVQINYDPSKAGTEANQDFDSQPKFRYTLEYGPVTQDKNLFISPIATGTPIDLATAEDEFDFTSRVSFEHNFGDRHEWGAFLAPMELIEFEPSKALTGSFDFAGATFTPQPDTAFEGRFNLIEARLVYRYRLIDSERVELRVGGGVQYLETLLDITQFRGSPKDNDIVEFARAQVKQSKAIASLRASYSFNDHWRLDAHFDGYGGGDRFASTALLLNWRPAPEWDLGFGYRYLDRQMSDKDISNTLQVGDLVLRVSHAWF